MLVDNLASLYIIAKSCAQTFVLPCSLVQYRKTGESRTADSEDDATMDELGDRKLPKRIDGDRRKGSRQVVCA